MTNLVEKTDLVAEFVKKLIDQFGDKANIESVLGALLDELQQVEAAAFTVLEDTILANSVGAQLDGIGQIVGEGRQGKNDDDYRLAISVRILLNTGSGTIEDLAAIVEAMTLGLVPIIIRETTEFPAAFEITIDEPITNGAEVGAFVLEAKTGGVFGSFRWFEATLGTEFRFDTAGQGLDDGLLGFSVAPAT